MKQKWAKSDRFERIGRFTVKGAPEQVFPLLCPVREYDWLPGWSCRMHYSRSGVAEKDAVFATKEGPGLWATWIAITYEPDRLIEYLIVSGRNAAVRMSASLESKDAGSTEITWRMLFTPTSWLGTRILRRRFSAEGFSKMLAMRKTELDFYLLHGKMVGH